MSIALFEKYSRTNPSKPDLQPIKVKLIKEKAFPMLVDFLKSLKPSDIIVSQEFYDVAIIDREGFEISAEIVGENVNITHINLSVFGENKRGRTRKRLRELLKDIRKEFSMYIIE